MSSVNCWAVSRRERLERSNFLVWLQKVEQRLVLLADPSISLRSRLDLWNGLLCLFQQIDSRWPAFLDQEKVGRLNGIGLVWERWVKLLVRSQGTEMQIGAIEDHLSFVRELVDNHQPHLAEAAT